MSIVLVRHGETIGNAARVIQEPDSPLSERGVRQAERVAERLCTLGIAHVLCSDFLRARMTAEPLRARGHAIEDTPLLQERDLGDLRGMSYDQLPDNVFGRDYMPPGGESIDAFHRRVARAFALIVERRRGLAGPLIVVTHGLVCAAILENHSRGARLDYFGNTALTILDPEPPFAVTLLNCTQHLDGDPALV